MTYMCILASPPPTLDQSNLGFLLSNQRTKETHFYDAPGATEEAAQISAQGEVQDLGYIATFPLLLNIADQPTYFIPLKDQGNLVKSYAMVNVAQYQIVATGNTVSQCEQEYIQLLSSSGVTQPEQLPQTQTSGAVAELRTAVIEGNSYYFVRLEGEEIFYSISAAQIGRWSPSTWRPGDHRPRGTSGGEFFLLLDGYTLTIDSRAPARQELAAPSPSQPEAEDEAV